MKSYSDMDITDYFKVDFKQIPPMAGRVLIAQPSLEDTIFRKTVIFLAEHNPQGVLGFILNRQVAVEFQGAVGELPLESANISVGGPVSSGSINFLHTLGDIIPGSHEVGGGVFMNGDFEVVRTLARAGKINRENFRVFVGYSGWDYSQLAKEIDENSWVVADYDPMHVMQGVYDSWFAAVQQLGTKFKSWTIVPDSPSYN